ncbi:TRAP-type mannitol/chloroaromatic compound transport system, substrate-binding protein [Rhizobiales bacterium GAS113]|nr:TRAP-type mannitol/chloroaromatic compound transport system, substrate-binding protein [Rhizobiales bacterium GAS113]SEE48668.1 TRAP-type mannitol/chloroaromatic compound transport system, substrate-binding protein [Rhizobiales bacterium GAS188]
MMKRRQFLTAATLGAATSGLAAPAVAQAAPELKWRLTSSFPKSFDIVQEAAKVFASAAAAATDGRFQIDVFASGEIKPGLQALDAVKGGEVEMAHTALNLFATHEPALAFATGVPFGLDARQQAAWWTEGGGQDQIGEVLRAFGVAAIACGNTGAQMGGWFRKEVKTPADFNGLKIRMGGLSGRVIEKLGAVPIVTPASEIKAALDSGALDAAQWAGPHDDERLGLQSVAPTYYFPGWHQGSNALHLLVNQAKWDALPASYQAILTSAASLAGTAMQAKYDARNPDALKKLVVGGAKLKPFGAEIMDAANAAANAIYAEIAADNAGFAKVLSAYMAFRNDEYLWFQVGEVAYDNYLVRARAKG